MNRTIGEFRLGEDLAIALDAIVGDAAAVTSVAAQMKPARITGNRLTLEDEAEAIDLTAHARGENGWTFSLPAAATAALAPGLYGIDARLTFPGGIEITERSGFISLSKAALS